MTDHLFAFKKIEEAYIAELDSQVAIYQHQRLGTKLLHVPCADNNKVFNIEFVTLAEDDSGVAHILEHSVLCGSEKFPVKEPFVNLLKGSLNTFLNAMTFSDKTMYPFASLNEKDFMGSLDVYLDAVFAPRITSDPLILKQEGWRLDVLSDQDQAHFNGVVYNEMKGALSSPDEDLDELCSKALFDNTYQFNSGGDPRFIPDLSDRKFLDFYRQNYHPGNCYIYLYGNMPLEPVLKAVSEKIEAFEARQDFASNVSCSPLTKAQYIRSTYPAQAGSPTYGQVQWVYPKSKAQEEIATEYALQLIALSLFNMESSKLRQRLLDRKIAQEIYAYSSTVGFNCSFYLQLSGLAQMTGQELEKIILEELTYALDHYEKDVFAAAFNALSFNLREGDSQSTPQGLIQGMSAMINWPYGRNPLESLAYEQHLAKVSEFLESGYLVDLARAYILENPHRVTAIIDPDPAEAGRRQAEEDRRARALVDSLSPQERADLYKQNRELQEKQAREDSPEALASLPKLTRKDLAPKHSFQAIEEGLLDLTRSSLLMADPASPLKFPLSGPDHPDQSDRGDQIPLLRYLGNSRGVIYLAYQFDLDFTSEDDIFTSSLLTDILGYISTENYSYQELTNFSLANTGGISISLNSNDRRQYLEIKVKLLAGQIDQGLRLLEEILTRSRIRANKERIESLLKASYSRLRQDLADSGISYARKRLKAYIDPAGIFDEYNSGISAYQKLAQLVENWEAESDKLVQSLEEKLRDLVSRDRLTLFYAGQKEDWPLIERQLAQAISRLPLRQTGPGQSYAWQALGNLQEAFIIPSDVQYVVAGNRLTDLDPDWQFSGINHLLRQVINTDYLWNRVRVKGGAYGCNMTLDRRGNLIIASYRDPECQKTYEAYQGLADYLANLDLSQDDLTTYLIGALAGLDQPMSFPTAANTAKICYDRGISLDRLQLERDQLLSATSDQVKASAELLGQALAENIRCCLGSRTQLDQDARLFAKIKELS